LAAQKHAGHVSIATTAAVYAHLRPEVQREVAEKLDQELIPKELIATAPVPQSVPHNVPHERVM